MKGVLNEWAGGTWAAVQSLLAPRSFSTILVFNYTVVRYILLLEYVIICIMMKDL